MLSADGLTPPEFANWPARFFLLGDDAKTPVAINVDDWKRLYFERPRTIRLSMLQDPPVIIVTSFEGVGWPHFMTTIYGDTRNKPVHTWHPRQMGRVNIDYYEACREHEIVLASLWRGL